MAKAKSPTERTITQRTMEWAIDLRLHGRSGYLGNGQRTALWTTRRAAQAALAQRRADGGDWAREHYWNRAKVVRVRVTIVTIGR